MKRAVTPPLNMYDAEERLRRAQIEYRIVKGLQREYNVWYKATRDLTFLPNMSRLRNRGNDLEREMQVLRAWITARGFQWVRA